MVLTNYVCSISFHSLKWSLPMFYIQCIIESELLLTNDLGLYITMENDTFERSLENVNMFSIGQTILGRKNTQNSEIHR